MKDENFQRILPWTVRSYSRRHRRTAGRTWWPRGKLGNPPRNIPFWTSSRWCCWCRCPLGKSAQGDCAAPPRAPSVVATRPSDPSSPTVQTKCDWPPDSMHAVETREIPKKHRKKDTNLHNKIFTVTLWSNQSINRSSEHAINRSIGNESWLTLWRCPIKL